MATALLQQSLPSGGQERAQLQTYTPSERIVT